MDTRLFNISSAELLQHGEVIIPFLAEDLMKFAEKDATYTTDTLNDLRILIDNARQDSDEIVVDRITQRTQELRKKEQECTEHFQEIRFFRT